VQGPCPQLSMGHGQSLPWVAVSAWRGQDGSAGRILVFIRTFCPPCRAPIAARLVRDTRGLKLFPPNPPKLGPPACRCRRRRPALSERSLRLPLLFSGLVPAALRWAGSVTVEGKRTKLGFLVHPPRLRPLAGIDGAPPACRPDAGHRRHPFYQTRRSCEAVRVLFSLYKDWGHALPPFPLYALPTSMGVEMVRVCWRTLCTVGTRQFT